MGPKKSVARKIEGVGTACPVTGRLALGVVSRITAPGTDLDVENA